MEYEDIITWEDFKEYAGTHYPEANKILEEAHKEAEIISSIMNMNINSINKAPRYISRKNSYNSAAKSRKLRARLLRLQHA
ncbi:MAG: hypothetical protein IJS99_08330 [Synergistaceae bacterium]|nr:hypothetical protein [Synergistaceae bacterium]